MLSFFVDDFFNRLMLALRRQILDFMIIQDRIKFPLHGEFERACGIGHFSQLFVHDVLGENQVVVHVIAQISRIFAGIAFGRRVGFNLG